MDEMRREMNGFKAEFVGFGSRLNGFETKLDGFGTRLDGFQSELREGFAGIRKDMTEMRKDMSDLRSMFRRTIVHVAKMTGDVADIQRRMAEEMATKDDISMLAERMDRFAEDSEDALRDRLRHKTRLDEHQRRIERLEDRRS